MDGQCFGHALLMIIISDAFPLPGLAEIENQLEGQNHDWS